MGEHTFEAGIFIVAFLSVSSGNALNLVLLADSVGLDSVVLGTGDDFLGQALGDALDRPKGALASTNGDQVESEVDSAEWGHVDRLSADHTGGSNTSGVLARSGVLHSVDQHLDWVLTGHQVDEVEGVLDDAHGHELLTVVTSVSHESVHEALDDWASGLPEATLLVASGGVRQKYWLKSDVRLKGEVLDENVVVPKIRVSHADPRVR